MLCGRCGALLGPLAAPVPAFCRKCDDHRYDRAFAIGVYEKGLAGAILELKETPSVPRQLRDMVAAFATKLPHADVIIPVPLSKHRRLERGFNQAELIARELSRAIHADIDARSLERHLAAHIHRAGMDDKARELSVRNVFSVTRPKLVAGRRMLLVDDVLTSGATASSCAKALKKHGAAEVNVFTLARAVLR